MTNPFQLVVEALFEGPAEIIDAGIRVTIGSLFGVASPLFILDALRGFGVGQQVLIAASAGFLVWYAYRAMGIGRMIGGFIGQVTRYGMAVGTFIVVSIAFGWLEPFTMISDVTAGGGALWGLIDGFVRGLIEWGIRRVMAGV